MVLSLNRKFVIQSVTGETEREAEADSDCNMKLTLIPFYFTE